jgi:hypothetical protein
LKWQAKDSLNFYNCKKNYTILILKNYIFVTSIILRLQWFKYLQLIRNYIFLCDNIFNLCNSRKKIYKCFRNRKNAIGTNQWRFGYHICNSPRLLRSWAIRIIAAYHFIIWAVHLIAQMWLFKVHPYFSISWNAWNKFFFLFLTINLFLTIKFKTFNYQYTVVYKPSTHGSEI